MPKIKTETPRGVSDRYRDQNYRANRLIDVLEICEFHCLIKVFGSWPMLTIKNYRCIPKILKLRITISIKYNHKTRLLLHTDRYFLTVQNPYF